MGEEQSRSWSLQAANAAVVLSRDWKWATDVSVNLVEKSSTSSEDWSEESDLQESNSSSAERRVGWTEVAVQRRCSCELS